ncbi:MAG: ABC transporter permease [Ignavibacteriaceae bacterium]
MIRNYLRIAVRKLLRNKSYTTINIIGLSVGIASCLLIFLIVQFELSFDNYHSKKDRIYRLVKVSETSDGTRYTSGVPFPVPDGLRSEYPQIEKVAAILGIDNALIYILNSTNLVEKKFKEESGVFYAESQLFDILDFKWLAGDPKTALSGPYDMVVTRETADKYFGNWKNAIGKSIKYNNESTYKISGIIENVPANSNYKIKVLFSYESYKEHNQSDFNDWGSTDGSHNVLVLIPKSLPASQLSVYLSELIKKHKSQDDVKYEIKFQPLSEVHFDTRFNGSAFSKELITALSLIAAFLLLIACVNFINLATAQAVIRSREVGVRKVLGSNKRQIVLQFLGETAVITVFAELVALVVAEISLPFVNNLLQVKLSINLFNNPLIIAFLIIICVSVISLSGFYPAFILSGINPIEAFKSKISFKTIGGISLRRGLVVLQFVIAQVLIIGMLVVVSQMEFFKNFSYGFIKNDIVLVPIPNDSLSLKKVDVLKNRILQQSGITNVSFSAFSPTDDSHWSSEFKFNGSSSVTDFSADLKWADADFFKTYNIQFVAGNAYTQTDSINGLVVNEAFARIFGYKNPQEVLGKKINFWHDAISAPIVGIVYNFHNRPLRGKINPIVMGCWKDTYQLINIRIQTSEMEHTLAAIEKIWNDTYPDYVYEYQFLDQKIDDFYKREDRLSQLYKIFASIAIFISCLGLYGLVSFMAAQRTKEVGIRKVLGASVSHIIYLFSKEFTILIGIAFLAAAPIAYYFMNQWLEKFAYRIKLGAGLFFLSSLLSIAVAWLTVGYRALKSAYANPVKSLKYE